MALFFIAGGIGHLTIPDKFLAITPDWVPFAREVILATGVCEIVGSLALLSPPLRRWAGALLALYTLCVWPANIKQALDGIVLPPIPNSWWYHGPRIAFQPIIIWAALYAGSVIDWPWPRDKSRA